MKITRTKINNNKDWLVNCFKGHDVFLVGGGASLYGFDFSLLDDKMPVFESGLGVVVEESLQVKDCTVVGVLHEFLPLSPQLLVVFDYFHRSPFIPFFRSLTLISDSKILSSLSRSKKINTAKTTSVRTFIERPAS